jgi:hypothetical protein
MAQIPMSVLLEILASLAQLHTKVDALTPPLAHADRAHLATILPLLHIRLGDEVFSVASLRQRVVATADAELAAALDAVGSTRALGKLFARAAKCRINGLRVERVSEADVQPTLWHVSQNL